VKIKLEEKTTPDTEYADEERTTSK